MPPSSTITVISRAREFSDYFFADNEEKENQQIKKRQPTIQTLINTSEAKKIIINNLVEAFVIADIPLEKVDKLQKWLCENCREGVSIIVDETTDSRARSVVNILFSYNGITKLTHVDYLESVNNCIIGQLIIQILVQWTIPFDLPLLIASDSAAYMKKCYRDVLKSIMPQLIHLPSWASINYFQIVHQLLADIKQTFVFCKSQRNTWFRMAFYIYQHLNYIRRFYNEESKENSISIIEKINSIFTDQQFNGKTKPIFPFIKQQLQQLEVRIIMGKTMTNFGSTVNLVLQKLNTPLTSFYSIFQQAYYVAYKKLENHVLQHPAHSLFKAVQIFNSRFLTLTAANWDIYSYQIIRELVNPSTCLIQEWSIYININLNSVEFTDLNEFWNKVSLKFLFLEKIACNYIWLPILSCAVERSFSAYNKILDDDKQNLSKESLKFLTMMYFNNQNSN
ncbi:9668_t:CDS:2 [Diversispora eburnea]|uniref:9668_t:CDS:1 n=1 Tax=Diversispora eburnea TaxID=1213867 RepID=A0A9N9CC67_9GLOM|nr:9668_t:CDS:2 [Diversispora eburnea]